MPANRSHIPHYGWIIAVTGATTLFACLGLARYAYSMLLPGMQADLALPYTRMGLIGTANFVGYLLSVLLAPLAIRRFRPRITITAGLVLIATCMFTIGRCDGFWPILALYLLVGMGGGFANIPMMALVTIWFRSAERGKAAGLVIAGNGAAIIFAGFLIPWLNRIYGAAGWRAGWCWLSGIVAGVALLAGTLLRNTPAELGLEPVGRLTPLEEGALRPRERTGDSRILCWLGLLYLAFGATFMIYGTFIVTSMVKEYGFSEAQAGRYWSWVGFFSIFSGIGFGALSDRIGRKRGLAAVFAVQAGAYLLAGLRLGETGLVLSIALYGLAVFAIPAIMAAAVGDYLGLPRAAASFATITVFFAVGQTIGPSLAGSLAAASGSFRPAYLLAALVTAVAAAGAASLPQPVARPD